MINKVILVGNVGADPEVRTLESGVKVARINLATTERMRNRETQELVEHTEWHRITLWRNLADVVDRFVKKGSQLYIEGSIRTREWTDQTGAKRYSTEIMANELKLLGRRSEGGQQGGYQPVQQPQQPQYQPQQQPQQPAYQPYQQPAAQPVAPMEAPLDDPDDLPF